MFHPRLVHWRSTNIDIYFQSYYNHLDLFSHLRITQRKEQGLSKKVTTFICKKRNESLPLCHKMYCSYIVKQTS